MRPQICRLLSATVNLLILAAKQLFLNLQLHFCYCFLTRQIYNMYILFKVYIEFRLEMGTVAVKHSILMGTFLR